MTRVAQDYPPNYESDSDAFEVIETYNIPRRIQENYVDDARRYINNRFNGHRWSARAPDFDARPPIVTADIVLLRQEVWANIITQDNIVETPQDAPQILRALEDGLTRHLNRIQELERNERLANRRIAGLEGRLADVDSKVEHCKKRMHGCGANYGTRVREDPNANPPHNQDPNPSSRPPPDQLDEPDNKPRGEPPSDPSINLLKSPAAAKEKRQFCRGG